MGPLRGVKEKINELQLAEDGIDILPHLNNIVKVYRLGNEGRELVHVMLLEQPLLKSDGTRNPDATSILELGLAGYQPRLDSFSDHSFWHAASSKGVATTPIMIEDRFHVKKAPRGFSSTFKEMVSPDHLISLGLLTTDFLLAAEANPNHRTIKVIKHYYPTGTYAKRGDGEQVLWDLAYVDFVGDYGTHQVSWQTPSTKRYHPLTKGF